MMKVLLVVLVSIAVTFACNDLIPFCDVYTECKCDDEIDTCCSKKFPCLGGYFKQSLLYVLLILGSAQVENTNGMTTVTCDGVPLCSNLKCRWVGQSYNENHITINGNYTHDKSVTVKCHQVDMYIF